VEMLWTTVPRSNETQLSAYIPRPGNGVRLPNAARAGRGLRRGGGRAPVSALSQFLQPLSPQGAPRAERAPDRPSVQHPLRMRGLAVLACCCLQVRHKLVGQG
jgi:hypothetical protein